MKHIIFSVFLIGLIFGSSNSFAQAKIKETSSSGVEEQQSQKAMYSEEDGIEGMRLNNGKKWKMDDHTRQSFSDMAQSFLSIDIQSLNQEALKTQGVSLQESLDALIRGCTMEGQPHDQLHIFLVGYMSEVESLAKTGRANNAKNIQYYLRSYSKYFN